MSIKIVADSSSDVYKLEEGIYESVPLKIITDEREYIDDGKCNVEEMADYLASYKGKSSTACPAPGDWLKAFGEYKKIICVTITSNLSGSYNAALVAKQQYEEENPGSEVFIVDSLSAGPELGLIVEKIQEFIKEGNPFETIKEKIMEYKKKTSLLFTLESLNNLANNGRVSRTVAAVAGILGIRLVGKASDEGTLEPLDKVRGEKKALNTLIKLMKEMGYKGGKVRINHCFNLEAAQKLKALIEEKLSGKDIKIAQTGALCSFYAEKGGMLVGFER